MSSSFNQIGSDTRHWCGVSRGKGVQNLEVGSMARVKSHVKSKRHSHSRRRQKPQVQTQIRSAEPNRETGPQMLYNHTQQKVHKPMTASPNATSRMEHMHTPLGLHLGQPPAGLQHQPAQTQTHNSTKPPGPSGNPALTDGI